MDIYKLKRQFLEYLEIEKGRSLKTVENYDRYISRFITASGVKQAKDISEGHIREFRLKLNRSSGVKIRGQANSTMKKNTQNYYMIALRSMLKYARKCNITTLTPDAIELAKTGARHLDLISTEELTRLLKAPDTKESKGMRDKAVLDFSLRACVSRSSARSIAT
jgi:site-specific recombinase XerD